VFQFQNAFLITLLFQVVDSASITWQFQRTNEVGYVNAFFEETQHSAISCVDVCVQTGGCVVANYNPGTRTCALVNDAQTFEANVNWHAYTVISGITWFVNSIQNNVHNIFIQLKYRTR